MQERAEERNGYRDPSTGTTVIVAWSPETNRPKNERLKRTKYSGLGCGQPPILRRGLVEIINHENRHARGCGGQRWHWRR